MAVISSTRPACCGVRTYVTCYAVASSSSSSCDKYLRNTGRVDRKIRGFHSSFGPGKREEFLLRRLLRVYVLRVRYDCCANGHHRCRQLKTSSSYCRHVGTLTTQLPRSRLPDPSPARPRAIAVINVQLWGSMRSVSYELRRPAGRSIRL